MNRRKSLAAAMCFALLLSACGGTEPAVPAPAETTSEAAAEQQSAETEEQVVTNPTETAAETVAEETGKTENLSLEDLRARLKTHNAAAGAAYVTYMIENDPVPVTAIAAADSMAVTYPFLGEIPDSRVVNMRGSEVYVVVPAEDITEVSVYNYSEGENAKIGKAVYQAVGNDPFLICCNVYDQGPNAIVELKKGDEVVLSYVPCLAAAILQKAEGVVDISLPENIYAFDGYAPLTVDGEALEMTLADGDENDGGPMQLTYRGQTLEVYEYADYIQTSYVADTEDGFYVFVQAGYASDGTDTILVQYTPEQGLKLLDKVVGDVTDVSCMTLDHITIGSSYDCFGTYGTYVVHSLKDGKMVPQTTYLDFRNNYDPYLAQWAAEEAEDNYISEYYTTDGYRYLRTKTSFEAAAEEGTAVTIPADAVLLPQGAEEATGTFFFTWEGKKMSVICTQNTDGFGWNINGTAEEDIFVTLPYAG